MSNASEGRAEFVAQARAAGLSAAQAQGLQAKVDNYLAELDGRGTQVSPNQIDMKGAVLHVTAPGEDRPRPLGDATGAYGLYYCDYEGAPPLTFCAFQYEYYQGEFITMYDCRRYYIPWYTTGSWANNQSRGTQPVATFVNGATWGMPPAYSIQRTNVDWAPVVSIKPC